MMKVTLINNSTNHAVEVDTIQTQDDKFGNTPGHKLAAVVQQDVIRPRDHKEFFLHDEQYITVKEKDIE